MRVLLIRNSYSYNFGGGERFPVQLAKQLLTHNIDATVVSRQPRTLDYAKSVGAPTVRGWWWSQQSWTSKTYPLIPIYLGWQLILVLWYLQLILRRKPDVVHPQSKDDFIAATIAGRVLGKHIIWTDHADLKYVFANHPTWYKNPVGKLVFFLSKYAHSVTLVSQSEKQLIEAALGHPAPANYLVIHNGIADEKITPMGRDQADKNAIIFCATSRLVMAKGIAELITAFRQLKGEHYRLWLVGDGPDEAQFKEQAAGDQRITFFGHSDTPLQYVAACDIFVHPSYHEGFSISLLEAAMVGKPIIACNVGGNSELINDTSGILVPDRDAAALYSAMQDLGQDTNRRLRLGNGARQTYVQQFDFAKIVAERFIPLYESAKN